MAENPGTQESGGGDTADIVRRMAELGERSQRIVQTFLERRGQADGFDILNPMAVSKAFLDLTARIMADPSRFAEAQMRLWRDYSNLWHTATQRLLGQEVEPVVQPARDDRRFRDGSWNEQILFDFIKQSYLLTADWIQSTVADVDGLDKRTARKVAFYTRQYVNAMAPSNFVATNPAVLRETLESKGNNLITGLENLLADLERGEGRLRISMTDERAFELGRNVAVTPGKVIFQNDLMQLIQYAPSTEQVSRRPLLIVPPWINKFYVLDLQPQNSFIKWIVDQGHTVFVISWVNPDVRLADKRFDDYMLEGPLTALDVVQAVTGEPDANLIGYCIGGTLLACMLAYMAARGDQRVRSATFLTTMIDFEEAGELEVFIDEDQVGALEEHMSRQGFLEGSHMAQVFNMMRDNDLIWSFVVNNYLLGKEPMPFDLLYWNSDSTRMPAMMHGFYLRNMYLENRLVQPGGINLDGVPIDLGRVATPAYILSTREDHIAPWKSTFAATRLYGGPVRFVLSASGHIAGVINPPAKEKYCYWTNRRKPKNTDAWLDGAEQHPGSWWVDWQRWVARHGGGKVAARQPGSGDYKPIEDAPGSYVKVR